MYLASNSRCCCLQAGRRAFSSISTSVIKENEVVLIRQEGDRYAKWHLTPPLKPGRRVKLGYGTIIPTEDLIGRRYLDRIKDDSGRRIEVQRPSLPGYIMHSKRLATPIYPQDAMTIVSLLDLHPTRPGEDDEGCNASEDNPRTVDSTPFEIFEAGTGMGSLTLHIARAIHAFNPPTPDSLRSSLATSYLIQSGTPLEQDQHAQSTSVPAPAVVGGLGEAQQADLLAYRSSRRAVLHTLDKNEKHSVEAYKFVRNFRRSQYLPSVDFHTSTTISAFLATRLAASDNRPFLSRAVLDLPAAQTHAAPVLSSLLPDGLLVIFAPSISQIAEFQRWCLETRQSARLENVLELPTTVASETMPTSGAGGRPWDVKVVRTKETGEWAQVMRPKVGERVVGGGFVAVVRKMREIVDDAAVAGTEEPRDEAAEGAVTEPGESAALESNGLRAP